MAADRPSSREPDAPEGRRRVWASMHALGAAGVPQTLVIDGRTLRLERDVKHDFWAATAFYIDEAGQVFVVKFGRTQPFLGLPMRWAGRLLARRESHFYRRLQDLELVPRWLGFVEGETGFVHSYAAGLPMADVPPERLDERFFGDLSRLILALHQRQMAYVDLHKPQNVIVGEDGRPYLIDFQISYDAGRGWLVPGFLRRWLLRMTTRADLYHLLKLKRRYQPELLSEEERQRLERRTWFIRVHRVLTQPYRWARRRLLGRLRRGGRLLPEGSR